MSDLTLDSLENLISRARAEIDVLDDDDRFSHDGDLGDGSTGDYAPFMDCMPPPELLLAYDEAFRALGQAKKELDLAIEAQKSTDEQNARRYRELEREYQRLIRQRSELRLRAPSALTRDRPATALTSDEGGGFADMVRQRDEWTRLLEDIVNQTEETQREADEFADQIKRAAAELEDLSNQLRQGRDEAMGYMDRGRSLRSRGAQLQQRLMAAEQQLRKKQWEVEKLQARAAERGAIASVVESMQARLAKEKSLDEMFLRRVALNIVDPVVPSAPAASPPPLPAELEGLNPSAAIEAANVAASNRLLAAWRQVEGALESYGEQSAAARWAEHRLQQEGPDHLPGGPDPFLISLTSSLPEARAVNEEIEELANQKARASAQRAALEARREPDGNAAAAIGSEARAKLKRLRQVFNSLEAKANELESENRRLELARQSATNAAASAQQSAQAMASARAKEIEQARANQASRLDELRGLVADYMQQADKWRSVAETAAAEAERDINASIEMGNVLRNRIRSLTRAIRDETEAVRGLQRAVAARQEAARVAAADLASRKLPGTAREDAILKEHWELATSRDRTREDVQRASATLRRLRG